MLPPGRSFSFVDRTTDIQVVNGAALLHGWSFTETTGSAVAAVNVYDGTSNGGNLIAAITLLANESTRDFFSVSGLEIANGIFCELVTGTISGAAWASPGTYQDQFELIWGARPLWSGST